jgi:hypothetical protein
MLVGTKSEINTAWINFRIKSLILQYRHYIHYISLLNSSLVIESGPFDYHGWFILVSSEVLHNNYGLELKRRTNYVKMSEQFLYSNMPNGT